MQKRYRFILLISVIILVIFGLVMIYSSSYVWAQYKFNNPLKFAMQQLLFVIIGFILMNFISRLDYEIYYKKANLIIIICLLLLVMVLIPGIGSVRNGSRSWFGIGSFGIQPSEFAKLGLMLFVSKYLSINKKAHKNIKKGILPILLIMGLVFALIMLQPDFGTAFVLMIAIIALLFVSGLNIKFFLYAGIIGISGIILLIVIAPYRMARITSFLNPWQDPLGSGFQIIQSLYAIGPGGILGMGFLNSRQKHFYLPEPQTDFIFAIICEEFGVFGALIVLILFFTLAYSGIKLALSQENLFKKYMIFGIIFQIIFQATLNLLVVIGLIPVTGYAIPKLL